MNTPSSNRNSPTRRKFIAHSGAVAAGTAIGTLPLRSHAQTEGASTIKIGLVGCGGRGSGAANQALNVGGCKLVAMADMFKNNLESSLNNLKKSNPDSVDVADDQKFVGFDGYKNVIDACDLVILATPPGFRPIHFAEAIEKNKHVFMEKPVAVDAEGVNKVLEYAKIADEKKRKVVVGLQRHYQNSYREAFKQVHDEGIIGDITSGSVYWNGGGVWTRERQPGMTEMEYQCLNWYYFNWLCGDHITEQHVHNLDVANWFVRDYPVSASGMGGREVRTSNKHGEIYDHHAVEFTYKNGLIISSQCRHIPGCHNEVREEFTGTKGRLYLGGSSHATDLKGETIWRHRGNGDPNPYQVEHNELQAAIKNDTPLNNAYYGAKSTFTSILGRLATYSGKKIDAEAALKSNFSLMPKTFALDADPPVMPDKDGNYPIAVPGQYKPF